MEGASSFRPSRPFCRPSRPFCKKEGQICCRLWLYLHLHSTLQDEWYMCVSLCCHSSTLYFSLWIPKNGRKQRKWSWSCKYLWFCYFWGDSEIHVLKSTVRFRIPVNTKQCEDHNRTAMNVDWERTISKSIENSWSQVFITCIRLIVDNVLGHLVTWLL